MVAIVRLGLQYHRNASGLFLVVDLDPAGHTHEDEILAHLLVSKYGRHASTHEFPTLLSPRLNNGITSSVSRWCFHLSAGILKIHYLRCDCVRLKKKYESPSIPLFREASVDPDVVHLQLPFSKHIASFAVHNAVNVTRTYMEVAVIVLSEDDW